MNWFDLIKEWLRPVSRLLVGIHKAQMLVNLSPGWDNFSLTEQQHSVVQVHQALFLVKLGSGGIHILGCRRVNHYCVFLNTRKGLQKNKVKVTQWKAFVITRESLWNQNNTIASRWGIWRATGWTHICNHCKRGFIDYTMFQDYHPARFKWTLSKKTKKRQDQADELVN